MNKTKNLANWIDEEIIMYCKYLKVEPPEILYSKMTYINKIKSYYSKNEIKIWKERFPKIFGSTTLYYNIIFLHIKPHKNKEEIKDTIIHELMHILLGKGENHTNAFYGCIENLKGEINELKFNSRYRICRN